MDMETLFIADDESSIREGLKCIIDWEALGFRLCGEASNGKDALAGILAMQPSLVMLDMKMPKMHGVEVIRLAREAGYQGKCIILIGYSKHSEGYPGWKPNPASPILKTVLTAFKDLFGEEGQALAIHAGLECGLFSEKYPDMDMVSYGPTMRGVHSPDERIEISTVTRFWELTKEILKRI